MNTPAQVVISTRRCCPAATHARLQADPHLLVQLTTPGARTADLERPDGWVELRHCVACEGTMLMRGQGQSRRWLYAISLRSGEALTFGTTLDEVVEFLLEHELPASLVSRYIFGLYSDSALSAGETLWLAQALERAGRL